MGTKFAKLREVASRWHLALDKPITFVVLVFGFAAWYFATVDSHVRNIVKDPDFVAEVAKNVRPAMVFDLDGRVLADMGALAFLESPPEVIPAPKGEKNYTSKIIVRPKKFMPEPILESLDISHVSVAAKRAKGISWEIYISDRFDFIVGQAPRTDMEPARFRLEIVVR